MNRKTIMALISLLIIINGILIFIDDGDKIDRLSYVDEWRSVISMDVRENIIQDGVIKPAQEQHIYFDKQVGSFLSFMVEKGETVQSGDPLYSYAVKDYRKTYRTLTSEINRLNGEINALQTAITQMENYNIPSDNSAQVQFNQDDINLDVELPNDGQIVSEVEKEQFILQMQAKLEMKEAQLDSIQNQLDELESSGDTITVESPYEGVVSHLSVSLNDPLLTISSHALEAYGELPEQQHPLVQEDMTVDVLTELSAGPYQGTVSNISPTPKKDELSSGSWYPFNVTFNEEMDTSALKPGYHARLDITLRKSENAPVVTEKQIFNDYVWKMSDDGTLELTPVKTGIVDGQWIEITEGLLAGDAVAYEPNERFRNHTTFITPLDLEKLTWYMINPKSIEWEKFMWMGLIVR